MSASTDRLLAILLIPILLGAAAASPEKPPPVTPEAISAGMAAAPELVRQAGLDCEVSDARKLGQDQKTGATYYEVACKGAEGFMIATPVKAKAPMLIYNCLEVAQAKRSVTGGAVCALPENADPEAGIAALVAERRPGCHMTNARALGHNDVATVLEVACQSGAGYIVQASYPLSEDKPATFTPCAGIQSDMKAQCVLTDAAATKTYITDLAAKAAKPCDMRTYRFVGLGAGINDTGDAYFEVACADGGGFILDVDGADDVYPTPCDQAGYIAGGCKLSKASMRRP